MRSKIFLVLAALGLWLIAPSAASLAQGPDWVEPPLWMAETKNPYCPYEHISKVVIEATFEDSYCGNWCTTTVRLDDGRRVMLWNIDEVPGYPGPVGSRIRMVVETAKGPFNWGECSPCDDVHPKDVPCRPISWIKYLERVK